jgi:hypothetical protein
VHSGTLRCLVILASIRMVPRIHRAIAPHLTSTGKVPLPVRV